MKRRSLLLFPLLLSAGCSISTPEGDYRARLEDIDYSLEVDIKGENRLKETNPIPKCSVSRTGDWYVAIAYNPPIENNLQCRSTDRNGEEVIYTIDSKRFINKRSAKEYADYMAMETGLDVIYGKMEKANEIANNSD